MSRKITRRESSLFGVGVSKPKGFSMVVMAETNPHKKKLELGQIDEDATPRTMRHLPNESAFKRE